jgi:arginase
MGQNRRGVDMGPSAVRYAGLHRELEALGLTVHDAGNVAVPIPEEAAARAGLPRLQAVAAACLAAYQAARHWVEAGDLSLFLGGDHSIGVGTVAAAASRGPVGLIWIDAHGDFNTPETSSSGNLHGMPVAALVGEGPDELVDLGHPGAKVSPDRIVQIGVRDLDPRERERLRASEIGVFTMRDLDERGVSNVFQEAIERLAGVDRLHVSLDMDALDPAIAPGVGTPVPGGLRYREAHLLMELLADTGRIRSADVVEINPILDERNRTAELAVDLVASLFGKKII